MSKPALAVAALAALLGLGPGCLPEPVTPSPRGVFPPERPDRPPPARPDPDPPPSPGPWPAPADDPPRPPPSPIPDGGPHPLDPRPLPAPWPDEALAVGPVAAARRVIADEDIVGFAALDGALLAGTATGGLFRATAIGGWQAELTPLPPLRWFDGGAGLAIACPADGDAARISLDAGIRWARLDLNCGAGGRRTIAFDGARAWILTEGGELWRGALLGGRTHLTAPIADPRMVAAGGGAVVVFGAADAAWSGDGERFVPVERAGAVVEPRDGLITDKGRAVVVGRAAPGRVGIEYSRDGGRSFAPAMAPERLAGDLARVTVDARGVFYATPIDDGPPLRSDDGARWVPVGHRPARGAVIGADRGAIAATARGFTLGVDREAPRGPGLDRPLWRVVFTHPRVAVATGVLGGLWRSTDGGARWTLAPGSDSLPFTDLDRVAGHAVAAVGEGLFRHSDDAGARWTVAAPPGSCRARWVRFAGARGLADCADGLPALSDDGGARWSRLEAPAPPRAPIVWLDGGVGVSLADDGAIGWTSDGGVRFAWQPAPAAFVELAPRAGGVSALGADGRIWTATGPSPPWVQESHLAGLDGPARAHRLLADGRVVVATDRRVYLGGAPRFGERVLAPLGDAPGARAVVPAGDGAILVLQSTATTRFEPR
ncbi:MAG: hypothetical protein H6703_15810 [Myxococcales bacterium]|nr:hypothetical protein [Myxococcales bacterium]